MADIGYSAVRSQRVNRSEANPLALGVNYHISVAAPPQAGTILLAPVGGARG